MPNPLTMKAFLALLLFIALLLPPLAEAQIAGLATHILEAPEEIRRTLFEIEGREIAALIDRKLIFRAEPAAGG